MNGTTKVFDQRFLETSFNVCRLTLGIAIVILFGSHCTYGEQVYDVDWIRQIGTIRFEQGLAISGDKLGNLYVSGETEGSLGGPSAGAVDAFLSKYDTAGELVWGRQIGTPSIDRGWGVSANSSGSVYLAGSVWGSLGASHAGNYDTFIAKYNESGELNWIRQLGTGFEDQGMDVTTDDFGNAYVVGYTRGSFETPLGFGYDALISKYSADGTLMWIKQFGTSRDDVGLAASSDDSGSIYIAGVTRGSLGAMNAGERDVFLTKLDAFGSQLWTTQFGTTMDDECTAVSADAVGNVYVAGTSGGPNGVNMDVFVRKYKTTGELEWSRLLGTPEQDRATCVSVDVFGNLYVSGDTNGSLGGTNPNPRTLDVFVAKYDPLGSLLWIKQLGTTETDESLGIFADDLGNAYVTGTTLGPLGGRFAGGFSDAFIAKLSQQVPEPSAIAMTTTVLVVVVGRKHRARKGGTLVF